MTIRGRTTAKPCRRPSSVRSRKRAMLQWMLSTALFHEILLMQERDADVLEQTLLSFFQKQKVSAIKKRAADPDPLIGIVVCSKTLKEPEAR